MRLLYQCYLHNTFFRYLWNICLQIKLIYMCFRANMYIPKGNGGKKFNEILGSLVYKPDGKVTLVPDSDKREAVKTATAEADFKEK